VCAYVILKQGAQVTAGDITGLLDAAGIAKQKYPEKFIFVDDFPKTASGKVRKDLLREDVRLRLQHTLAGFP
jgi:non-ribosomal peptide synthetase component E (peptide arylation enzyme)